MSGAQQPLSERLAVFGETGFVDLSFRIRMKNPAEEKAFIDEMRTKNGNLEISLLPYAELQNQL